MTKDHPFEIAFVIYALYIDKEMIEVFESRDDAERCREYLIGKKGKETLPSFIQPRIVLRMKKC